MQLFKFHDVEGVTLLVDPTLVPPGWVGRHGTAWQRPLGSDPSLFDVPY